ncbi:MAG TPA: beta-ketoacyl synthase N-terminal-like domain-containing protein [Kineosporiaceae bacterium]
MTPTTEHGPLRRAMETISSLRTQLETERSRRKVAIVGIGLRGPGDIQGLDALWDVVQKGADVTGPLPEHRRDGMDRLDLLDQMSNRAGWLATPFGFDAPFFGISRREATAMDPQHRLTLEVVWEAFEHAAIPPGQAGARTGVYVGTTGQDHRWRADGPMTSYWTPGNGHAFAAGRVAYTLGLEGPAMAVDTACSSALSATHLAARALEAGDCDLAVAVGVNLILTGQSTIELVRTGALSPTGRCRPFDAHADGFVRGEGCVALVLKRVDDARRDGDRVLAVIEASGLNQDGRSAGFTAPNPGAQTRLVAQTLARAGLSAADVGYVQAHGTGTLLGDPIEAEALAEAMAGRAVHVTSVKANVGHTEAAAGLFGLACAVACLRHRWIPPQANLEILNPRLPAGGGLIVPRAGTGWPADAGDRAMVSSFGMSGTNACVVLGPGHGGEATAPAGTVDGLVLSAGSEQALRRVARNVLETLSGRDVPLEHVAETLLHGRARLAHTVRIGSGDRARVEAALQAIVDGIPHRDVHPVPTEAGQAEGGPRRVADLPPYPWEHVEYRTPAGRRG